MPRGVLRPVAAKANSATAGSSPAMAPAAMIRSRRRSSTLLARAVFIATETSATTIMMTALTVNTVSSRSGARPADLSRAVSRAAAANEWLPAKACARPTPADTVVSTKNTGVSQGSDRAIGEGAGNRMKNRYTRNGRTWTAVTRISSATSLQ